MKILYIHQYFVTPEEPGGTRSYWLAKELVINGHEVVMLTSSDKYEEEIHIRMVDGIKVYYIHNEYYQSMTVFQRLRSFFRFMYKSSKISFFQKNIDLVFVTSTPLTVGVPALLIKLFKRIPYIFEVRDLWPEVPIQMGALTNPIAKFFARSLEKLIYKHARHVIALSPGMQDGIIKYIPRDKTSVISNMSKIDDFSPRVKDECLIQKLNIKPNSFKIVHFGSLGIANGVDVIIESAKILKTDPSVEFLFLGGGSTEEKLIHECERQGLYNVKFLGKFPMKMTSEIVNLCDVSIVSFKDIPILYTNSPNKLFDSLSAGKPIIVNSAGWTKDLVEENRCGMYVNPNDPMDLVNKVKFLKDNPELVVKMGRNSRLLAENVYDKSLLSKKFVEIIEKHV